MVRHLADSVQSGDERLFVNNADRLRTFSSLAVVSRPPAVLARPLNHKRDQRYSDIISVKELASFLMVNSSVENCGKMCENKAGK